jgi:hypothetical protein
LWENPSEIARKKVELYLKERAKNSLNGFKNEARIY